MKVRATNVGEYKGRIYTKNEEFYIYDDKHFSPKWMENIEPPKPSKPNKKGESK